MFPFKKNHIRFDPTIAYSLVKLLVVLIANFASMLLLLLFLISIETIPRMAKMCDEFSDPLMQIEMTIFMTEIEERNKNENRK